jgi:hypothetical protein
MLQRCAFFASVTREHAPKLRGTQVLQIYGRVNAPTLPNLSPSSSLCNPVHFLKSLFIRNTLPPGGRSGMPFLGNLKRRREKRGMCKVKRN